jgi:hypothetical protein
LASGIASSFERTIPDITEATSIPFTAAAVSPEFKMAYIVTSDTFPVIFPSALETEFLKQGSRLSIERVESINQIKDQILDVYDGGYSFAFQNTTLIPGDDREDFVVTIIGSPLILTIS